MQNTINHDMGMMTQKEHDEMVRLGALVCRYPKQPDAIRADYPKLVVMKDGEDETIDMGGNLFQITQERDSLQAKGKKAYIEYFPRAYATYMEKKKAADKAYEYHRQAINSLV
jgi:hypothetical protein